MYISKTKLVLTGILAASLIVIVTANSQKDIFTQGQEPYIPSRLEWLELVLAANHPALHIPGYPGGMGYTVTYVAVPKENTIHIMIDYAADMEAGLLLILIEASKKKVLHELTLRGWQDWCKIEMHTDATPALQKGTAGNPSIFVPIE